MRSLHIFTLIALNTSAVATITHGIFETADFNVPKALIDNGFNVSSILGLSSLVKRSPLEGCSIACDSLKFVVGDWKLSQEAPKTYWSQQQLSVKPRCTFIPTAALEVSTLFLLSRLIQYVFSVKSGGHAAFPASNIEGGITVDLVELNKLVLSADNKTVAVGPGNRWKKVYDYPTPYNLAMVGGRASTVGIGGLTLGGGISHHTNKYGLACDNIASYEMVSASGAIIAFGE